MKKLFNFRLSLFIVTSLILGISISYFAFMGNVIISIIFSSIFVLGIVTYLIFSRKNFIKAILFSVLFILTLLMGFFSFRSDINSYQNSNLNNHYYQISGRVKEVYNTESGNKLILDDVELLGVGHLNYKVSVYVYRKSSATIGDEVSFFALLKDKNAIYEGRLNASEIEQKIKFSCNIKAEDIVISSNKLSAFEKINVFIRNTLEKGMEGDSFSISFALLTGNSEYIDEQIITSFRNTGVAHIFAVSGLHIGFLATALTFIFRKIQLNKFIKAIIISVALFLYSGVCGFSASSIRASIMCTTMLLLSAKGDRYDGISALSISALIILLLSPIQLFCVGFQLSFGIVFGILTLSPPICRCFKFLGKRLSKSLGTVISAQIVGIPILLYAFNSFSLISIVVNLLFIPIVGVLYLMLVFGVIIGGIFNIAIITLFIPKVLVSLITYFIRFFDSEIFIVSGFSFGAFVILYFVIVILLSDIINLKSVYKITFSVVLAIVLVFGSVLKTNNELEPKMIVSGDSISFTIFSDKTENVAVISYFEDNFSLYRIKRIKERENIDKIDNLIVQYDCETDKILLLTTRLLSVIEIDNIFIAYEVNDLFKRAFNKSFPDVNLISCFNNKVICSGENFKLSHIENQNVVICSTQATRVAIFPGYNDGEIVYFTESERYDYIIAYNRLSSINSKIQCANFISYRQNSSYINSEDKGNLKYYV